MLEFIEMVFWPKLDHPTSRIEISSLEFFCNSKIHSNVMTSEHQFQDDQHKLAKTHNLRHFASLQKTVYTFPCSTHQKSLALVFEKSNLSEI
mmetsp:Transcript_27363/g.35875  ORF Transcript_27363/g.35875 Transcript_27363/m.35875 type:complete len:92 (-) Transcript_27363:310-585(-)